MHRLTPIIESLQPLFELEKPRAIDGKYIYTEIQYLKETTENYTLNRSKGNFLKLQQAVRDSMNYIEKWKLDFTAIKSSLDKEARAYGMPPIDWPLLLSHSHASLRFQFSALNHAVDGEDFLQWIAQKSGVLYNDLNYSKLVQLLVEYKTEEGFSKRLSQYLIKDPNFLYNLMMASERNFIDIAHSALILYLTDEHLAEAIIRYLPQPAHPEDVNADTVTALIEQLNHTLSHGRSISTLLRNANAKELLDSSIWFQIYQSEEYTHRALYAAELLSHHPHKYV